MHLPDQVPPDLVQLDLIKPISISDLDLSCMPKTCVAFEMSRGSGSTNVTAFGDPKVGLSSPLPFGGGTKSSNTRPTQSARPSGILVGPAYTIEKLASKLDELVRRDMVIRVLLVGRAPARRCAFVYVEPSSKRWNLFYYVPYCK